MRPNLARVVTLVGVGAVVGCTAVLGDFEVGSTDTGDGGPGSSSGSSGASGSSTSSSSSGSSGSSGADASPPPPMTCTDGQKDGNESDVDCGGLCAKCPAG